MIFYYLKFTTATIKFTITKSIKLCITFVLYKEIFETFKTVLFLHINNFLVKKKW